MTNVVWKLALKELSYQKRYNAYAVWQKCGRFNVKTAGHFK